METKTVDAGNGLAVKSPLMQECEMLDELYGDGSRDSWRRIEKHVKMLQVALYEAGWRDVEHLWDALQVQVYGSKRAIGLRFIRRTKPYPPKTVSLAGKVKSVLLAEKLPDDENFVGAINEALAKHLKRRGFDIYKFLTDYSERKKEERKAGIRQSVEESARQIYDILRRRAENTQWPEMVGRAGFVSVGPSRAMHECLKEGLPGLSVGQIKSGLKRLVKHDLFYKEGHEKSSTAHYFLSPRDPLGKLNPDKRVYLLLRKVGQKRRKQTELRFEDGKYNVISLGHPGRSFIEKEAEVIYRERLEAFKRFQDLKIIFIEGVFQSRTYEIYLRPESDVGDLLVQEAILDPEDLLEESAEDTAHASDASKLTIEERFVRAVEELAGNSRYEFEEGDRRIVGPAVPYNAENIQILADMIGKGKELNNVYAIKSNVVVKKGIIFEHVAGDQKYLMPNPLIFEITDKEKVSTPPPPHAPALEEQDTWEESTHTFPRRPFSEEPREEEDEEVLEFSAPLKEEQTAGNLVEEARVHRARLKEIRSQIAGELEVTEEKLKELRLHRDELIALLQEIDSP